MHNIIILSSGVEYEQYAYYTVRTVDSTGMYSGIEIWHAPLAVRARTTNSTKY